MSQITGWETLLYAFILVLFYKSHAFSFYFILNIKLAGNEASQEKLRKQINEDIIDENGKIIYEKLLEHEYLNQVYYEGLRLHEPIGLLNRECSEDINLDCGNGRVYKIEKGIGVNIAIHSIHRDPGVNF